MTTSVYALVDLLIEKWGAIESLKVDDNIVSV